MASRKRVSFNGKTALEERTEKKRGEQKRRHQVGWTLVVFVGGDPTFGWVSFCEKQQKEKKLFKRSVVTRG